MVDKKNTTKKKRAVSSKSVVVPVKATAPSAGNESPGKNYVGVDYPQVGEILTSGQYSIRISTSAMDNVALSIDGKDWQPCRECVGFWWYDWSGFGSGAHTVVARIAVGKRFFKSKPRSFTAII